MKARRANQLLSERAELSLAKLQKEQATAALRQAQAERAELELQRTRGEVVLKVDVDSEGFQRGCTVKAILRGWVGNLPGRLEGLSASQMVGILDEEVESVLRALNLARQGEALQGILTMVEVCGHGNTILNFCLNSG